MIKIYIFTTLLILVSGCSPEDSDYLALYDTRHASETFIIDSYRMYPGLDVPSRYIQNGDTAVVYQFSVSGEIENKMWVYEASCGLAEGDIETDVREIEGAVFNESRVGLDEGRCEHSAVYDYVDYDFRPR